MLQQYQNLGSNITGIRESTLNEFPFLKYICWFSFKQNQVEVGNGFIYQSHKINPFPYRLSQVLILSFYESNQAHPLTENSYALLKVQIWLDFFTHFKAESTCSLEFDKHRVNPCSVTVSCHLISLRLFLHLMTGDKLPTFGGYMRIKWDNIH